MYAIEIRVSATFVSGLLPLDFLVTDVWFLYYFFSIVQNCIVPDVLSLARMSAFSQTVSESV